MPTLFHHHEGLPWPEIPVTRSTTIGHGKRITRTIKVAAVPDWIDFFGAAQVAQVRRTVTKKGRTTVEVVYLITSADHLAAPPEVLAGWTNIAAGLRHYARHPDHGATLVLT